MSDSKRKASEGWEPVVRPFNFYTPVESGKEMQETDLFLTGYIDRHTIIRLYMSNHEMSQEAFDNLIKMITQQFEMAKKHA